MIHIWLIYQCGRSCKHDTFKHLVPAASSPLPPTQIQPKLRVSKIVENFYLSLAALYLNYELSFHSLLISAGSDKFGNKQSDIKAIIFRSMEV